MIQYMQARDSNQVPNEPKPSENRKRKCSTDTVDASQNPTKSLKCDLELNPNSSNECSSDSDAVQPYPEDDPSTSQDHDRDQAATELPSLHDYNAIHDFFRRQRNQQEHSTAQSPSGSAASTEGISHDPMKQIIEQSDKEMSVKEALAKGFRNYRVRLPKKRFAVELDPAIDPSVLYSLFAKDTDENRRDAKPSLMAPQVTVRDALSVFSASIEGSGILPPQSSDKPTIPQTVDNGGLELDVNTSVKREPSESPAVPEVPSQQRASDLEVNRKPSVYTLPPFWKLPLVVSKGYRGGYYVRGVKYVQMTTLIHKDALAVSLEIPIRFEMDGEIKTFTLNELLRANGVAISDPNNCSEISKFFTTSVLLVLHLIAEHLLCYCGPNPLNPNAKVKLDCEPILISAELPPIVCHKPHYFGLALNSSYGPNEIFDPCKQSAPSPAISEPLSIFEDKKPCFEEVPPQPQLPQLPARPNIPLTARQKGLIVTHYDTGASFDELAAKFRVSTEDIEYIILNRAEVIRDQTAALMAENDVSDERERIISSARRKSRVRRTSFVGLNILMWRFFKDCRDAGIVLNGKLLKEHAMMISRQLGLENFKGSEGWLDAFKRRHQIDLKLMSGVPVNYEETDEDRMDDDHDESQNASKQLNFPQVHSEGTTAALLDCVEKAVAPPKATAPPVAVVSIANTKPLDLNNLFGSTESATTACQNSTYMDTMPTSRISPARMSQQASPAPPASDEKSYIAAIVKSAAIRVYDKELSSALETVRSYILSNDPSVMPMFLELQMKLAVVSREQSRRMREDYANCGEPQST
ncbi:hypothetical protein V3C99_002616 [Haemonchus contortus]